MISFKSGWSEDEVRRSIIYTLEYAGITTTVPQSVRFERNVYPINRITPIERRNALSIPLPCITHEIATIDLLRSKLGNTPVYADISIQYYALEDSLMLRLSLYYLFTSISRNTRCRYCNTNGLMWIQGGNGRWMIVDANLRQHLCDEFRQAIQNRREELRPPERIQADALSDLFQQPGPTKQPVDAPIVVVKVVRKLNLKD